MSLLKFVVAAAGAVTIVMATPALAVPGATNPAAGLPQIDSITKVNGFHCEPRYSASQGWHRHWGACKSFHSRYPQSHGYWSNKRWQHRQYGAPKWL